MATSTQKARQRARSKVRNKKVVDDANSLAYSLTKNASPANLDLKAVVLGYTHRGGFKVAISNIEQLTDALMDHWKSKCVELGYTGRIGYNASLSTAILYVSSSNRPTPDGDSKESPPANFFGRVHPLTIVAAALFAVNAGRHYLSL